MMQLFDLIGLFLVLSQATFALSQKYLIAPNSQPSCHTNTACFTLDELAQGSLTNGVNLTLIFQPGEHTLTLPLSVHNFTHVHMIGLNTSVLTFHDSGRIELSGIDQLSIASLKFTGHTMSNGTAPPHIYISTTGNLSISSCYLTGLSTRTHDERGFVAIIQHSTIVVVEDVVFIGTTLNISEVGFVSIENSTFTGNKRWESGAVYIEHSTVAINNNTFANNTANKRGGAIYVKSGSVSVTHSVFKGNSAGSGGGIAIVLGTVRIYHSVLTGNYAKQCGGGIYVSHSGNVSVYNSTLTDNNAEQYAGGIYVEGGSVSIYNSTLIGSHARLHGGAMYVVTSNVSIYNSTLCGSHAKFGGGIRVDLDTTVSIYGSTLKGNTATYGGGVLVSTRSAHTFIFNSLLTGNYAEQDGGGIKLEYSGSTAVQNSTLADNHAGHRGGGIYAVQSNISVCSCTLIENKANEEGSAIYAIVRSSIVIDGSTILKSIRSIYISQSMLTFLGENSITSNNESMYTFNSQVHIKGPLVMDNNCGISGGAIKAVLSTIHLNSAVTISNNTANHGGGVFVHKSTLFVSSPLTISHNTANEGGAIYAYQSTIEFNNTGHRNVLANNVANNGGGIHATDSIITISQSFVHVDSNTAEANGGGLFLQQNSKLYINKHERERTLKNLRVSLTVSNNKALLEGGGTYINDSMSGGGACNSRDNERDYWGECFIQTIKMYNGFSFLDNFVNTFITHNIANQSGSAIYGGLLDRCTVSQIAEISQREHLKNGFDYVWATVQLPKDRRHSISSDPLKVMLCNGSQSNVSARKGQPFQLHIKALDQAGNSVNATIHGAVVTESGVGRLKEGQVEQRVGRECTQLEYNVFSEDSSAQLELYAIGPCTNHEISKLLTAVMFLNCTCPLGFHSSQSNIECSCECDPELQASECFAGEGTFQSGIKLWVGVTNFTDCMSDTGYLVHDCPFDYCVDQAVNISLNSSEQIDRQCAYNRSGVLCGECEKGLSLMFATSKCKQCSNAYLLLLIPFTVAGITLVVFILWLNITVAAGPIYGTIFYANVLAANKAIFLPFKTPNFLTVFVSWVNLDLGIETCFYDGMNSQAKVLLQLAFPVYLFLLVFLIIIISKHINSFAKLLSNRNPVAALCTLLILSYSKLLRLIIAALQYTSLHCTDNLIVWVYDGNVQYFSPSHIPRFVVAAIILIACVLFTTLLFFGQCFPRCSKWKLMKWTKNTKYIGFMDTFHAPFTPKHRYWPGLLLFGLIAHNLAASMAPDTAATILPAGCMAIGLIVYKSLMNSVYRNRFNDALETFSLLNMVVLALGTLSVEKNSDKQLALAYVSMAITFILFLLTICYHFYKYVIKKTNVWNNQVRPLNPARRIKFNFHRNRNYQRLAEINEDADAELPAVVDMYTYGQEPREETDPDKYITPPIIRPAERARP